MVSVKQISKQKHTVKPVVKTKAKIKSVRQKKLQEVDDDEIHIDLAFTFDKSRSKLLLSRGLDPQCLASRRNSFDAMESVTKIVPDIKTMKMKTVSVRRQIRALINLINNPLRGAPVVCISSFPSDLRAKIVAMNLMNSAINYKLLSSRRDIKARDLPLWHVVTGGFKDNLREQQEGKRPCMLILTNVNVESTPAKIEKLRDILELYSDIPRIVITGGEDPITFFATRLRYPLSAALYFGSTRRVSIMDV